MRGLSRQAWLLLATTLITNVGNGMHMLTVGKLMYDHTGAATMFGVVIVLEYVAAFVFQVLAGPWVDRGDPKWSCVLACLLRGLTILMAALMLYLQNQIIWVVMSSLVIQAIKPFYRSAQFAMVPVIVPARDLMRFNSYNGISLQIGQLLGVALVGPMLVFGGAPLALSLNGCGFLLAAALSMLLSTQVVRVALVDAGAGMRGWLMRAVREWLSALSVMRASPTLFWLLLFAAGDFLLVGLVNLLLAPMIDARYGGNEHWLSILDGGFAVGAMATAFFVEAVSRRYGERNAVLIGLGGQFAGLLALAFVTHPIAGLVFMVAIGGANTISSVVLLSVLQEHAPSGYRGRLSSVRNIYLAAFGGAAVPLVSHLEKTSLTHALLASACIGLLFWIAVYVMSHPNRRRGAVLGGGLRTIPQDGAV